MAAYEGYQQMVLDSMRNSMGSVAGIPPSDYYCYTLTEQDEDMLRDMMKQMPPREVRKQIERSQRFCLERGDRRGIERMRVLLRRAEELAYVEANRQWTPSELRKIESHTNGEFDISAFLKKVNPIKLKQEE